MTVEVIPTGSSAVVTTDKHNGNNVELMHAIKDAEAGIERSVGDKFVSTIEAIKDGEAGLERSVGDKFVNTIEAIKDGEAGLERSVGDKFALTMGAIKDSEAGLERSMGDKFVQTVQDIKDSEANLERSMGDNFVQTVQDIKDSESRLERSNASNFMRNAENIKDAETRLNSASADRFMRTIEDVKNAAKDSAHAHGHTVEVIKNSEFQTERSAAQTREMLAAGVKDISVEQALGFDRTRHEVERAEKELLKTSYQLSSLAERTALENQKENLINFKDQALLSERLAGHQALLSEKLAGHQALLSERLHAGQTLLAEKNAMAQAALSERLAAAAAKAAECCCEIKSLIVADGQKTRDLVNTYEHERLRDKANRAEAQLAAYFAAKVAPVVPL